MTIEEYIDNRIELYLRLHQQSVNNHKLQAGISYAAKIEELKNLKKHLSILSK